MDHITDAQIFEILSLTTHMPCSNENGYPENQCEGMDTYLGTQEELIAKVRAILERKPATRR